MRRAFKAETIALHRPARHHLLPSSKARRSITAPCSCAPSTPFTHPPSVPLSPATTGLTTSAKAVCLTCTPHVRTWLAVRPHRLQTPLEGTDPLGVFSPVRCVAMLRLLEVAAPRPEGARARGGGPPGPSLFAPPLGRQRYEHAAATVQRCAAATVVDIGG